MSGGWVVGRVALLVVLLSLVFALGCGGSDGKASGPTGVAGQSGEVAGATASLGKSGALRKTRWAIIRVGEQRVQIGAFVPYCGEPHPRPHIERVISHRAPRRVVLTMLVRYPPVKGACVGEEISVMRWVAVKGNSRNLSFYDGVTSPPQRRLLH